MEDGREIWRYQKDSRDRLIAELEREVDQLQKCCTQRGARMQKMREHWSEADWWRFTQDVPAARQWFDEDGVPK